MPRPWQLAGVAGLLLALLHNTGCGPQTFYKDSRSLGTVESSSVRALSVNTIVARRTPSYQQLRSYSGIIRARRTSELSFGRAGKVVRMLVDHGEDVRAGDPIAEQDTSRLGLQKDELETARAKASTELGKLIANSQLRSMESVRIEVGDLQTELNQIKEEIKAQENPNPGAQVRLDKAQQRLDILDAVSGDPQVTAQQAVIAELDSQLAALEVELAQGTLVAPFDGTVAQRFVNEGTMVSPGVAIVRLVETNSPQAWISIPSDAAQDAREGESHVIQVDGKKLGATVSAKLPELDRTTRTRTIIFSLDNIDADTNSRPTLPGAVAQIELGREVESPGFWLPITSLTRGSRGLWSVYAVARMGDGKRIVSRRSVEVIHTEGERARVRGTLDDGDLVISDGTHRVVPGQRVEPIEVSATRELSRSDLGRSP